MKIRLLLLTLFSFLLLTACSHAEPDPPTDEDNTDVPDSPTDEDNTDVPDDDANVSRARRTVLVYMVADNSLGKGNDPFDRQDIAEMAKAVDDGATANDGRLLIYHNRYGTIDGNYPVLVELRPGLQPDTLKRYPDDPSAYSVDPSRMTEVFADIKALAPANDYGLVLWSHGTGWVSETTGTMYAPRRSFGSERHGSKDKTHRMSINTLAETLDSQGFSFIYFDCCHMMTIETLYALRHCADVIAGSPTELPAYGMDYSLNLPCFFANGDADLVGAANATFNLYNACQGALQTCTMSVVRTQALDALASATRNIFALNPTLSCSTADIQKYTRSIESIDGTLFDFANYIDMLSGVDAESLAQWHTALDNAVAYAAATPWIFKGNSGAFAINRYCGIATYIISNTSKAESLGYFDLEWWTDVINPNNN